jgi:hypothetical protein
MNRRQGWTEQAAVAATRHQGGQAALLALLIVVLVMLWARVLGSGSGPAGSVASAVGGIEGEAGRRRIDEPMTGMAVSRGEGARGQGALFQEWLSNPLRAIERDLFAVRLEHFPTDGSRWHRGGGVAAEGFWEQLEKSTAAQADQRREREILVENLRRQAGQLRLETIVMGERPGAMISGQPVGEGDVVKSFRVVRIEARRVVIEREGIRFELQMK